MDFVTLKNTLFLILESINKTDSRIDKYIALQDYSPLLQFEIDDDAKKREYSKFMLFSSKLVSDIERTDRYISTLSAFICQADDEMHNNITPLLSAVFNEYERWRTSAKLFLVNTENVFNSNDQKRYSSLLTEARALSSTTQALCKTINNGILKITDPLI